MAALPLFIFATLVFVMPSSGLEFEMQTKLKCIFEEINANALVVGDYKIFHKNQPDQVVYGHLRVLDPYGNVLTEENSASVGQFAFTSAVDGEYQACFTVQDQNTAMTTKIMLDWKTGVAATDWNNIAKKEHLDELSLALRKLEENIRAVYNDMLSLQDMEARMRSVSDGTNSRVAWYSALSLIICMVSGVWQVWYLKKFFQRKKLM